MRRISVLIAAATGLLVVASSAAADPTGPQGPVVTFMGQRYAVSRGAEAFESIAFDAANRRLASAGAIRDFCGAVVSAGPDESPGLAWDAVTQLYWQITNDRVVRRWNGGALVDTAFAIPLTFDVPGSGPDTLETVRGIAVDATHVYVVDAGPAPGEIASNAWFKFTRGGVPVKSSKSTDFNANLDADPDALADDIVWVPLDSPVAPGLLLVALEHSGIQVIDTEGAFVAKFRWSTQSLPPATKPTAFAGLAIDPLTGNLFLADNDQTAAQTWTLLPAGPTSYVIGTGGSQAALQYPHAGCNLPLWRPLAPPGSTDPWLIFGIAYRPLDNNVYGVDYATGDLWRFDPRLGRATLVAATGESDVWGCAYDTERDVLYGTQDTFEPPYGSRILIIDPDDGATVALPTVLAYTLRDIAFHPGDQHIYGVAEGQLLRVDRDSGTTTVVGPTQPVVGLDYDPVSGLLVGMPNGPALYHIDPATAAADSFAPAPHPAGVGNYYAWEGLAVVPVPSGLTAVSPSIAPARLSLRVTPNPASGVTTARFSLPAGGPTEVAVYDLAGRLVRRLHTEPLPAGPQQIVWDARDADGRRVAGGIYLLRVLTAGQTATGRVVILR